MTSNDTHEGHADGIAGRAPQARDGDLPYLAGYISGGLERLALQIAEVKAAVMRSLPDDITAPRWQPRVTPPPIPHAMHGD